MHSCWYLLLAKCINDSIKVIQLHEDHKHFTAFKINNCASETPKINIERYHKNEGRVIKALFDVVQMSHK